MMHYVIELGVWTLLIFFIGCLIGWLLRKLFGSTEPSQTEVPAEPLRAVESVRPAAPPVVAEPEPAPAPVMSAPVEIPEPPAVLPVAMPAPAPAQARMERPRGLEAARGGEPDQLQRINGIGPKNEKILHTLGFFHFDQIAAWTPQQISWVDDHLKFNGRIGREEWIEQSRLLAGGAEEEFNQRFGPRKNRPS